MTVKYSKKEVWIKSFGEASEGIDYSGRKVKYSAYNNRNSRYAWNTDHIRPISDGGTNKLCNLIACHIDTNDEKGDDFPHWEANGKRFKVKRTSKNCYKIISND